MKLTRVEVSNTLTDTHGISWDVVDAPGDHADGYIFYAEWSSSLNDEFSPVTDTNGSVIIIDGAAGPFFIEQPLFHTPHDRPMIYRMFAVNKSNPSIKIQSHDVFVNDQTDGIIKTMQYAESLLYGRYIGDTIYFFKRKFSGQRCPECWNPYQYKITKTNCQTCRGTGYVDGYYKPIRTQCAFEAMPKIVDVQATGELQTKIVSARITSLPIINPRDLIVRLSDNSRYTIARVDQTKIPNLSNNKDHASNFSHVVSQILILKELEPSDIAFSLTFVGNDITCYLPIESPPVAQSSGIGMWSTNNMRGDAWIRNSKPESFGLGDSEV